MKLSDSEGMGHSMPEQTTKRRRPLDWIVSAGKFLEEGVPAILLAVSVLLLCADVVARYVFNSPIPGAGSIAMICFIWVTFIGSAAIARRGRHIVIDVVFARFPVRLQAIVQVLVQLLVLAIIAYVLYFAWDALLNTRFVAIPGLGISRRIVVVALFIGFLLMGMYALRDLVIAGRGVVSGKYEVPQDDSGEDYEALNANAPIAGNYNPPTSVTEAVFLKDIEEELIADKANDDKDFDDKKEERS